MSFPVTQAVGCWCLQIQRHGFLSRGKQELIRM